LRSFELVLEITILRALALTSGLKYGHSIYSTMAF
jgi:hypothetical protein